MNLKTHLLKFKYNILIFNCKVIHWLLYAPVIIKILKAIESKRDVVCKVMTKCKLNKLVKTY